MMAHRCFARVFFGLGCVSLAAVSATAQDQPGQEGAAKQDSAKSEDTPAPLMRTRPPVPVTRDLPPRVVPPPRIYPMAPPSPPPPPSPTLTRAATPKNQTRWARYFDYPEGSAFLGEEGTTGIRVEVLPNGRAGKCEVTFSSGFAVLDERACRMITRYGRFNPALDAEGNPTQGFYINRIRWQAEYGDEYTSKQLRWSAPDITLVSGQIRTVGVAFDVEPDGAISRCVITASSGSAELDSATCRNVKKLKPSKAEAINGQPPVTRTVRRKVVWSVRVEDDEQPEAEGEETAYAHEVLPAISPHPIQAVPIGSPRDWLTNADYPVEAWRNKESGLVRYRLDVDQSGTPVGCEVTYSSASPALDAATCALLTERALFRTVENDEGELVSSTYSNDVYWNPQEPEFLSSFTIKVGFTVDENGNMKDCQVIKATGALPKGMAETLERDPCPQNSPGDRPPFRDENGVPIEQRLTLTLAAVVEDVPQSSDPD